MAPFKTNCYPSFFLTTEVWPEALKSAPGATFLCFFSIIYCWFLDSSFNSTCSFLSRLAAGKYPVALRNAVSDGLSLLYLSIPSISSSKPSFLLWSWSVDCYYRKLSMSFWFLLWPEFCSSESLQAEPPFMSKLF